VSERKTLYQVQEVDTHIFELREREENHPLKTEVEALEEEKEERHAESQELAGSLEESRKKQRVKEDEVQGLEEKLGREEEKLYGGKVTNPKELRGLQAEVRSLKKKKDALETELLEEMESQDEIKRKGDELQADVGRLQAEIEEKRKIFEGEIAEIRSELADLEEKRRGLRSEIGDEFLELYDGLLENRHGLAVVKVSDGVCLGCRVELPGIEYDRFLKSESIFTCTNCGRILVK
jgi:predicted  nucleic acid-binding Zn-ribbon protein